MTQDPLVPCSAVGKNSIKWNSLANSLLLIPRLHQYRLIFTIKQEKLLRENVLMKCIYILRCVYFMLRTELISI